MATRLQANALLDLKKSHMEAQERALATFLGQCFLPLLVFTMKHGANCNQYQKIIFIHPKLISTRNGKNYHLSVKTMFL